MANNKSNINGGCLVGIICGSLTVIILTMSIISEIDWRKIDPLDNSYFKFVEVVAIVNIYDKDYNGFKVVYSTTKAVTSERLQEINSRSHITSSLDSMKIDAMEHFPQMLDTDIYEFLDFILPYDPDPDIKIDYIMVQGSGKQKLYSAPNPAIENSVTWINATTQQGMQYINYTDIRAYHNDSTYRLYRYWKCPFPWNRSSVDERFSHFDEAHRITGDASHDRLIKW